MTTVPLPERPNLEQLKKQAKLLHRAVREGNPKAVALVAEHHRDAATATFSLDSAQFVLARSYGFASWAKLRQHVVALDPEPAPRPQVSRVLTVENRYHAQPNRAADEDVRRAARTYPELAGWRPLLTVHHNGVKVIAFGTPDGPRFCELTPTTITLSPPATLAGRATLTFHTAFGTLAGIVAPDVTSLSLERPTDLLARERVVIFDGIFVVPNAFPVTPAGLVFRYDHHRTGDIVPVDALPAQAVGVADRPAPPADRQSPAGQRLAAAIAAADAPPVVDPDQWSPGVHLELTGTDLLQLGRYGNLLGWHNTGDVADDRGLFVFDFGPQQGPLQPFAVFGATIAATRMYYGFRDGSSDMVAVVGLVDDERVTSITFRRDGEPDAAAVIDGGTFVVPGLIGVSEYGARGARLTVRDAAGDVLEDVPYRQER